MCGRYYVDDETAREIERLVKETENKLQIQAGDIHPSEKAPALTAGENGTKACMMTWGFPGIHGKGLIANARAESAREKSMFRSCVRQRRCAVPAASFYEWDERKNKYMFQPRQGRVLLLAGLYQLYGGENHFVILTTAANRSVERVHERMPLILNDAELPDWLNDTDKYVCLLRKTPDLLVCQAQYEQRSFL